MNDPKHISLADLQCAVMDGPTRQPLAEIEAHVSICPECQQRMLSLAAEPAWRNRLATALTELQSSHLFSPSLTHVDHALGTTDVEQDPYEVDAARRFLESHLDSPSHPELLGRLGRYDIERIIGLGGMGVVVRGFDRELHRPVAIKMVLPRWSHNGTAKQRFAREARAAAAILHPNVIAIHGIEEKDGIPYFVMPFVAGPTLQSLVDDRGPLEEHEIVQIALQIASGLSAAHSQGLVHRDIKPGNVLVDNSVNRVVITDFGLARCEHDQSMTRTGWLAGTPNYMSPEQSRGEDVDPRSDLFSLGSLIYFLSTGRLPFIADSPMGVLHKISHESHRDVRQINERISSTLAAAIDRLLEKDKQDRFQSAAELESFLHAYLNYLHRPAATEIPKLPAVRRSSRSQTNHSLKRTGQWIASAAVMLLLFSGGVVAARWLLPDDPVSDSTNTDSYVLGWNEIAEKHQLMSPDEYNKEVVQLFTETTRLEQDLNSQGFLIDSPQLQFQMESVLRSIHDAERYFEIRWPNAETLPASPPTSPQVGPSVDSNQSDNEIN